MCLGSLSIWADRAGWDVPAVPSLSPKPLLLRVLTDWGQARVTEGNVALHFTTERIKDAICMLGVRRDQGVC